MNFTNDQLLKETHKLVKEERRLTVEVIQHLKEISRRKLYLDRGYPSLFEMCVREFGYSNAAAQRRIEAMRLITELPEVIAKIQNGEINLSVAAQVQTFFRQTEARGFGSLPKVEERAQGEFEGAPLADSAVNPLKGEGIPQKRESLHLGRSEKLSLIQSLEHKSTREVEKILISKNPDFKSKSDHLRPVSADRYELKLTLSIGLQEKLERIKALLSHKQLKDWEGVIGEMADLALKKLDLSAEKPRSKKKTKAKRNDSAARKGIEAASHSEAADEESEFLKMSPAAKEILRDMHAASSEQVTFSSAEPQNSFPKTQPLPASEPQPLPPPEPRPLPPPEAKPRRSRFIKKSVKREVWKRDHGQCAFVDPETGRKCSSRHFLQFDHIHPFVHGGSHTAENLRVFCGEHNRWRVRREG